MAAGRRWGLVLLAAAAIAATVLAVRWGMQPGGAGPAPQGAGPAPPGASAEAVRWPLPWNGRRTLVYEEAAVETTRSREHGEATIHSRGTTRIGGSALGEGYLQRWRSEGEHYRVEGGAASPVQEAVLNSVAQHAEKIVVEVRLDEGGGYAGIDNLDAIVPLHRDMIRAMFEARLRHEAAFVGRTLEPDAPARHWAQVEGMMAALSEAGVVEAQVSRIPAAYNVLGKGGLVPGQARYAQVSLVDPVLGERSIPHEQRVVLLETGDGSGDYEAHWTLSPEHGAFREVLEVAFERMSADDVRLRRIGLDAFVGSAASHVEVNYRIDPATGVVRRLERIASTRYHEFESVSRQTLTLTEVVEAPGAVD